MWQAPCRMCSWLGFGHHFDISNWCGVVHGLVDRATKMSLCIRKDALGVALNTQINEEKRRDLRDGDSPWSLLEFSQGLLCLVVNQ